MIPLPLHNAMYKYFRYIYVYISMMSSELFIITITKHTIMTMHKYQIFNQMFKKINKKISICFLIESVPFLASA